MKKIGPTSNNVGLAYVFQFGSIAKVQTGNAIGEKKLSRSIALGDAAHAVTAEHPCCEAVVPERIPRIIRYPEIK